MPELHEEIAEFLKKHAKIAASYDPEFDDEEDRFNGPDSSMLNCAAELMAQGKAPCLVHSEWGSGCYEPYYDGEARAWHDRLVDAVNRQAKG